MNKYIELHYMENNEPVCVNISKIDYVTKQPKLYKDHAVIMIGEFPLKVAESYGDVMTMLIN